MLAKEAKTSWKLLSVLLTYREHAVLVVLILSKYFSKHSETFFRSGMANLWHTCHKWHV